MTIAIVGTFSGNAGTGSGSTLTATLPTITGPCIGLVIAVGAGTGTAFNTPSTQSWSALPSSPVSNGANYHCAAYWANLSASDSGATFTMTNGAPTAARYAFVGIVLTGVATAIDANGTPTNDITANTAVNIPSVTPVLADCLMLSLCASQTSVSNTQSTPYTPATSPAYSKQVETSTTSTTTANVAAMIQTLQLTGQAGTPQSGATGTAAANAARDVVYQITLAPGAAPASNNPGAFLIAA